LHQLLQALQPRDATESGHRARMLELLEAPGDPFAREHYIPGHFTASAFVVSPERDALLMILHDKLGLWLQPGGHVEPSDADVVAAARREVAEEVQLQQLPLAHDGIFDVDIHVVPARRDAPAHQHFDVRFLFEAAADSGRASSDVRDARWIRIDDIGSIHTDESVMRAVRKLSDLRRGAR
jgi:8-oxo-dGTP pyrophosphatase MutT (NUDIX family)